MELETVIVRKENGIATIMLNRAERLNAINTQLINDLVQAVRHVGEDDETRAVVLTGAGRAFCAGGDFRYSDMRSGRVTPKEAEDIGEGEAKHLTQRQGRLFSLTEQRGDAWVN